MTIFDWLIISTLNDLYQTIWKKNVFALQTVTIISKILRHKKILNFHPRIFLSKQLTNHIILGKIIVNQPKTYFWLQ